MQTTLSLTSILVEDRLRKEYGDIDILSDDIHQLGLIQPLVLTLLPDGRHKLVAGGRRHAALLYGGYTEVHHGVTCDPKRPGFVYANELPPEIQRELELAENLQRLDMHWSENVRGVCEIHNLYKNAAALKGERWTRADTGERLGGYSDAYIDNCFDLLPNLDDDAFKATVEQGINDALAARNLIPVAVTLAPGAMWIEVRTNDGGFVADVPPASPTSVTTAHWVD